MSTTELILLDIMENTRPKSSMQIIVSGKNNTILTPSNPPIELAENKRYDMETFYSLPNVDDTNNVFWYLKPEEGDAQDEGRRNWIKIEIPEGSYELRDINLTIQ